MTVSRKVCVILQENVQGGYLMESTTKDSFDEYQIAMPYVNENEKKTVQN